MTRVVLPTKEFAGNASYIIGFIKGAVKSCEKGIITETEALQSIDGTIQMYEKERQARIEALTKQTQETKDEKTN